ncbi:unnamed protein product [Medioppia subpectinata]|uniref:RING-CH-type domain-containing protein n=1 Tax=Medioppia subpectinata TaxID=1979941 RepID=A0A7R9KZF7_9ACAR|nr:unnamed protein product [Medioppia subpectinata]CAG2111535.1 unnamed protein product [Medioppia subpectinata]
MPLFGTHFEQTSGPLSQFGHIFGDIDNRCWDVLPRNEGKISAQMARISIETIKHKFPTNKKCLKVWSMCSPSSTSLAAKHLKTCRICLTDDHISQMVEPCLCAGSAAAVHYYCLIQWISVSRSDVCGVCRSQYRFIRLTRLSPPFTAYALDVYNDIKRHKRAVLSAIVIHLLMYTSGFTHLVVDCQGLQALADQSSDSLHSNHTIKIQWVVMVISVAESSEHVVGQLAPVIETLIWDTRRDERE